MTVHKTSASQLLKVAEYTVEMKNAGLPTAFVAGVMQLAQVDGGVFELLELWAETTDRDDREQLVADLQDVLEEARESSPGPLAKPRIAYEKLDDVASAIVAHKQKLRALVDKNGGVTAVARRMEVPQSSLSRMLGSASMPRRTTLYKLANALDVDESEVVTEWVR